MWGAMANQGYIMGSLMILLWWAVFIWVIVFTILVVVKLDRIIQLLEKK